jgi:hypothetical protein
LADAIGKDVAGIAALAPQKTRTLVVDPFTGSANTLYWLLRHLPGAQGIGLELDAGVFQLTRQNMAALALPIDIQNTDYLSGLTGISVAPDELLVAFLAPPWGEAFDRTSGLDLRRTTPPIAEIVDLLLHRFAQSRLLFAVQIYEIVDPVSMAEVRARFEWSTVRVYELNTPGQRPGILLGTKGWAP